MSLLRVEVLEILDLKSGFVTFKGSYTGGSKIFSPVGFTALCKGPIEEKIYILSNLKEFKILTYGEGHEKMIIKFLEELNQV